MWTWSFELADVLTTLTIISTLGGMAYYLVIRPFLQWLKEDRSGSRLVSRKRRKKRSRAWNSWMSWLQGYC